MKQFVICVDEKDKEIGIMEKLEAHEKNCLHRAFSLFIFNSKGEMLLQKRASNKYHSGGLWTNACCSHPEPSKELNVTIHERLIEEMGFDCPLKEIFSFTYFAQLDDSLSENEFDHVFIGYYDGIVIPNALEAEDYKWITINDLTKDVEKNPDLYTVWFRIAFEQVLSHKK